MLRHQPGPLYLTAERSQLGYRLVNHQVVPSVPSGSPGLLERPPLPQLPFQPIWLWNKNSFPQGLISPNKLWAAVPMATVTLLKLSLCPNVKVIDIGQKEEPSGFLLPMGHVSPCRLTSVSRTT